MALYHGFRHMRGADGPVAENVYGATRAERDAEGWTSHTDVELIEKRAGCSRLVYGPYHSGTNLRCLRPYSFGEAVLFNRIWVEPSLIECGFITEDLQYNISIWNAWMYRQVQFTLVDSDDASGTDLTYPSLPHVLQVMSEEILTLDVYLDGPPVQDAFWYLEVDDAWYTIEVTGLRVLQCKPCPDWDKTIRLSGTFETVIFQTERFVEQRRPLIDAPERTLSASFLLTGDQGKEFYHQLLYAHDKVFGVPIYNELMLATSIPNGGTVITLSTDTTYLYHLNNLCDHIAIIDHRNSLCEIKTIDSIAANSITVTQEIDGTFNANTAYVYPVFMGIVTRYDEAEHTEEHATLTIEFREYTSGG